MERGSQADEPTVDIVIAPTAAQYELIRLAAHDAGKSVEEFVLLLAVTVAQRVETERMQSQRADDVSLSALDRLRRKLGSAALELSPDPDPKPDQPE